LRVVFAAPANPANPALSAPPALVSTLHDPEGRFIPALEARGGRLAQYAGVYVRATAATAGAVCALLRDLGAAVDGGAPAGIGAARRLALRAAVEGGHAAFLYCDFDRWLHWAGSYPDELRGLPERIARRRPRPGYVCLGRTARAYATHPLVQRLAETATNHAFGLALGRRIDATAGACWIAAEAAALLLRESAEPTNATDLEWPALVHRAAPGRLAYLATEGLEFETAEFYQPEVVAAGGVDAWARRQYERPDAWLARLRLATDSVAAAQRVLSGAV
jgi:hypothetical protein